MEWCGGLERTDVSQFPLWEGVMVLTELISLTVSTLGGCGGPDRTNFKQFLLWAGMLVLKN